MGFRVSIFAAATGARIAPRARSWGRDGKEYLGGLLQRGRLSYLPCGRRTLHWRHHRVSALKVKNIDDALISVLVTFASKLIRFSPFFWLVGFAVAAGQQNFR